MSGRGAGLNARLLIGQAVLFAAMAATTILTGLLVGPPIFDAHMRRSGHADQPLVLEHTTHAFRSAGLVSLLVGLGIACVGAFLISLLMARRVSGPLRELSEATRRVAAGEYTDPVTVHGTREVDALAASFNEMAARLAQTEAVRARLLGDLAHELRTPLASIGVLLEAWEDGVVDDQAALVGRLREQTGRLVHLTHDIKAVSDVDENRLGLDLTDTTAEAVLTRVLHTHTAAAHRAGVDLAIDPRAELSTRLRVDENRICQVLDNLVGNALRHTGPGQRITLHAAGVPGGLRLRVSDTGDGIDAEHLPHVFDRFYRTDSARDRDHGGSGIGLTISRAIARAHHGTLTAGSPGPGQGSVFTLTLPLSRL